MITRSTAAQRSLERKYLSNFYTANKYILILTIGWLIFKLVNFYSLLSRPVQLYETMNYFSKFLMPTIPSSLVFNFVCAIGILFCSYLLLAESKLFIRILLALVVLWVNAFQWSWGFESVVSHTLIFSHLCTVFIPFSVSASDEKALHESVKMIKWFYAAILITYTFSGIWKWVGLVYKLILRPSDVNWLSDFGAWSNAIVSFRNYDLDYFWVEKFFYFPIVWQVAFLIMNILQTISLFAVNRIQLHPIIAIVFSIFHLVNALMFKTVFITAIFVMLILFFPYHLINRIEDGKMEYDGITKELKIIYKNGDIDFYNKFDAVREYYYSKFPICSGLLYLPGVKTIANKFFFKGIHR